MLLTGSTVTQRAHPAPRAQGAKSAAYLEGTQATSNAAIGDAGAFERHRNYGRAHKLRFPVELRDPEPVARARDGLPPTEDAVRLASVLGLLADPVRSQSRRWA